MKAAEFSGAIYRRGRRRPENGRGSESPTCCRKIPERWSLGDGRWHSRGLQNHLWLCRQGFPEPDSQHILGKYRWRTWIFVSLTRHMLPVKCPLVPEPYSQTELVGEGGEAFTCWMTSQCHGRGALMTVRGCSGETLVHLDKEAILLLISEHSPLSSCASGLSLPGSMLRKDKSSKW